ncbi:hypothetical protein [uncultured Pseudomonas sp.]|uniref:hypothetical protein n=1 Tax=uncultured Pseudomonas sp. TaxID=114707 RepID=UPI0025D3C06C|nr:hypothetical protein [uncultured Pseudomonas sp.]
MCKLKSIHEMNVPPADHRRSDLLSAEMAEIDKNESITAVLQLAAQLTGVRYLALRKSNPSLWLGFMENRQIELSFHGQTTAVSQLEALDKLLGSGDPSLTSAPAKWTPQPLAAFGASTIEGLFTTPIHTIDGTKLGLLVAASDLPLGRLEAEAIQKNLKLVARLTASMRSVF